MSNQPINELHDYLGEEILQHELMVTALTHASANQPYNNERLEFMGDAVLGSLIAKILYQRFNDAEEGVLTRWRSYLVRRETLAEIAREIQLSKLLIVGMGEEKTGGRERESILANTLEAVIGAIYLIQGEKKTETFFEGIFSKRLDSLLTMGGLKDAKSQLQEILQKDNYDLPEYTLEQLARGELFSADCKIEALGIKTQGQGQSKSKAEQNAAKAALIIINKQNSDD